MSEQEFEPRERQSEGDVYKAHYPYSWSGEEQEGMPRDEPLSGSDRRSGGRHRERSAPWWARPQPQQSNGSLALAGFILLMIFLLLVFGGLGIVGLILGSLAHILGFILGAILALLIFVFLFVIIIVSIIGRAFNRAFGQPGRRSRRTWRNW